MRIGIIDADLITRKNHQFPNLASMKISGYWKNVCGADVELKTDYENLNEFDKVYISKVFTDTPIDQEVLTLPNVEYGGTGFFYDAAPPLPPEIEHQMPDYHLYDEWVDEMLKSGVKPSALSCYQDCSIGFMTRGCFRGCEFCVNKGYKKVELCSPLEEFYDPTKKRICLLDDNVLASPHWREIFEDLQATGKKFQFKQGLDERLLTDEKCEVIFRSKYDEDYKFAFDNFADYDLIKDKLELIKRHTDARTKFYVLCGFDRNDKWDDEFWLRDIVELMERIKMLISYQSLPYVMRYERYEESPYRGVYISVAAWCNQPPILKRMSLREFGIKSGVTRAKNRYIVEFEKQFPWFAEYMDMRWPR